MRIGMIGLGKLGLPVALAIQDKGHQVLGYDISQEVLDYIKRREMPYKEVIAPELLRDAGLETGTLPQVVEHSDIIFLAVQTPHDSRYEGTTRLPDERVDFDYSWLTEAITDVCMEAESQEKHVTLVVISTCLPGTYRREIEPLLNEYVNYVYNPFFIAMGQVISDFLNPEFVLMGYEEDSSARILHDFYNTIHNKPHFPTDITTAEAIKVSYNTFITMKTVLANTWGEIAHKVGANFDDIYRAWCLSTDRLISTKYLKAGMGDGGGCHPRDNIALSWLARKLNLSHDLFEDLMYAREDHAEWLADLIANQKSPLPIIILGRAFKPETNIETGSPSLLVARLLKEIGVTFTHAEDVNTDQRAVFFIGTQHERYSSIRFREGSTVIDPFGYIQDQHGVRVIRIGRP